MNKMIEDLKKLKTVYHDTQEIVVGKELTVVLQLLTSVDETEVHAHAMTYSEGLAYLYSVKRETLCRAIVGLNGTSIPNFVDSLDEKGAPEKLERHLWLRKYIISGWNQMLIDQIWTGYAELISRVEGKMLESVKEEPKEK